MDLFEIICNLIKCEYISDIRFSENLETAEGYLASLNLTLYPLSQLRELAQYLYGGDYTNMSKEEIVSVLKFRRCAG